MCGVVGFVDRRGNCDSATGRWLISSLTDALLSRGPDGRGVWVSPHAALGHRRLAVIDLDNGSQPWAEGTAGGEVVLTYNGELYNSPELREELADRGHKFRTRCDTEVVFEAYLEWGLDCVSHFNGIFAFGIWDETTGRLMLARDPLGVKPLYYFRHDHGVAFGSLPRTVFEHPEFRRELATDDLHVLFNARLATPDRTGAGALREVPPGGVIGYDLASDELTCQRYWQAAGREHPDSYEKTVQTVRELVEDAVTRQTVADVPVSSMLSGGIDSTSISGIATRWLRNEFDVTMPTFCVEFDTDQQHFIATALRPEIDAPYAQQAAAFMGSQHNRVRLDRNDLTAAIPRARDSRDLPSLGQFDSSMLLLFERMRLASTVALSAESADETFGGYPWHHSPDIVNRDGFPWMGDAPRLGSFMAGRAGATSADFERARYEEQLHTAPIAGAQDATDKRMREVLYFNQLGPLQYLLQRADRVSMAVGLEVRVPYCDHRIVDYATSIPWQMKAKDGRMKAVLADAIAPFVPRSTLERKKSGYPGIHDPLYEAAVVAQAKRIITDPSSPLADVFDARRMTELIDSSGATMTWLNLAHFLTPVVEVEAWMKRWGFRIV
jgi:asparagine synthase (glutamine-hydrolysing)